MLVYILALPYFIFMYYLYRRGHSWTRACSGVAATQGFKWTLAMIFLIMALSPAIAFFMPSGTVRHVLNIVANFHLGIVIYLGGLVVLGDLIKFILKKTGLIGQETLESRRVFAAVGGIILVSVIAVCIYGGIHSKDIVLHEWSVSVDKELPAAQESKSVSDSEKVSSDKGTDDAKSSNDDNKLTIALVSDTHLAYNTGLRQVRTIVKYINDMDADIVCMPGDFFTNVYDDIREPDKIIAEFRKIKSRYGVYGCWGNHDVDEPILAGFTFSGKGDHPVHDPRMISFLKKSGIEILEDEYRLIDGRFYIAGRLDAEKPGIPADPKSDAKDKTERQPLKTVLKGIDTSKPIIMLDHEPRELEETAAAGVDLDLSGHTHDGQFFPLNLTQYLIWPNPYGIQMYDRNGNVLKENGSGMSSVVTSGAGVYGPNMRVGTDSEVVKLIVSFK